MIANNVSVLALQETHFDGDQLTILTKNFPDLYIVTNDHGRRTGTTIIARKSHVTINLPEDKVFQSADGRCLIVRINSSDRALTVGSVYAPADNTSTRESFYRDLTSSLPPEVELDVLAGDWNGTQQVIDRTSDRHMMPAGEQEAFNLLLDHAQPYTDLVDGWRLAHPNTSQFTFDNRNHLGSSRIDRIYLSDELNNNTVNWLITKSPIPTDHKMVSFSIKAGASQEIKRGPGRWQMNPMILRVQGIREGVVRIMSPLIQQPNWATWAGIKSKLQTYIHKNELKTDAPIKKLQRKLERQIAAANLPRRSLNRSKYNSARRRLKSLQNQLAEIQHSRSHRFHYNALAKEYLLGERPSKYFFSRLTPKPRQGIEALIDDEGTEQRDAQTIVQIAESHFTSLCGPKESETDARDYLFQNLTSRIPVELRKTLTAPISASEVKAAVGKARTGRVPGLDGIPFEFYKAVMRSDPRKTTTFLRALFKSFQKLSKEKGDLPEELSQGVISLLMKKGDPRQLKNYRPLTILNTDYKLFTWILTRRLLPALDRVIGHHQTAFLPKRRITDNIKLVQCVIDEYNTRRDGGNGLSILFLDQEKAYDRVSHEYLYRTMDLVGIPRDFINLVRGLYKAARVKIMINGTLSSWIPVECGVRQGDALSCALYILSIEPLFVTIEKDGRIKGAADSNRSVLAKTLAYADDTVIFGHGKYDITTAWGHVETYGRASGARPNQQKSVQLLIGNCGNIDKIPGVPTSTDALIHLGVPVGANCQDEINETWVELARQITDTSRMWIKSRLSLKGRVMIANAKLLSRTRYLFLYAPPSPTCPAIGQIEKAYWALVMNEKAKGPISRAAALLHRKKGGLGAQHLETIRVASALSLICRMESHPSLPWTRAAVELMRRAKSRSTTTIKLALDKPWRYTIASRRPTLAAMPSVQYIWDEWWKHVGYETPKLGAFRLTEPTTANEIWATRHAYFPYLTQDNASNLGAALWKQPIWKVAYRGELGLGIHSATQLGMIWDVQAGRPRQVVGTPTQRSAWNDAVQNLYNNLPRRWKDTLENEGVQTAPTAYTPVPDFDHASFFYTEGNKTCSKPLADTTYSQIYQELIKAQTAGIDLNGTIEEVRQALDRLVPDRVHSYELIWNACMHYEPTGRQNDLLFRLLHGVVRTGSDLHWLEEEAQKCPIDGDNQTIEHLWLTCSSATILWEELEDTWRKMEGPGNPAIRVPPRPRTKAQLLGLLALTPYKKTGDQRLRHVRYKLMSHALVWTIWKAYTTFQFKEHDTFRADEIKAFYQKLLVEYAMRDKMAATSHRYANKERHNKRCFKEIWGRTTDDMSFGQALLFP